MKKVLIICFLLIINVSMAFGHGGRTDRNGGHRNSKTGEYHYHNGGSSASEGTEGVVVIVVLGVIFLWIIGYNLNRKNS